MKQQIHIWNIHNHKPIDQFISELIESGHEVKSTMATTYHNGQIIRAVVITEESKRPAMKIALRIGGSIDCEVITLTGNTLYYSSKESPILQIETSLVSSIKAQ